MPDPPAMPLPPDSRIIPLDRQDPLTHAQVEQVRFGLGDTGPLAQAVMNANVPALAKQLAIGAVSCLSTRRPADPVVGQMIFETDTKLNKFWDGTAWVTGTGSSAILTPVGSIVPYAGTDVSTPAGWLFCGGQAVSRTTYSALFAVIGTTYGAGDGSTTFNVPDLRGRVVAGKDNMAGSAASRLTSTSGVIGTTLGASGGDERLHQHTHAITDPGHTHTMNMNTSGYAGGASGSAFFGATATSHPNYGGPVVGNSTGISNQNAGSGASQNVQPTLVTNYIIKALPDTVTGYAGTTLTGSAGGDLTGTYPNPSLTTISNVPVYNSNSTISVRTSNVERLGIDASGRVITPYQPRFYALSTSSTITSTTQTTINFNSAPVNVGSYFNTSTYTFTAPVAGQYFFSFALQKRFAGNLTVWWNKNGTATRCIYQDLSGDSPHPTSSIVFTLAANDTLKVDYSLSAGDLYMGSGTEYFSYFLGYLLG